MGGGGGAEGWGRVFFRERLGMRGACSSRCGVCCHRHGVTTPVSGVSEGDPRAALPPKSTGHMDIIKLSPAKAAWAEMPLDAWSLVDPDGQ